MRGKRRSHWPLIAQPLPSVEPAFDLAGLLDESDASVRPALLSAAFEGFPDDRDDDFAMVRSFRSGGSRYTRADNVSNSRRGHGASRVKWSRKRHLEPRSAI